MTVPMNTGSIAVRFDNHPDRPFRLEVTLPEAVMARIDVPLLDHDDLQVVVDGQPCKRPNRWGRRAHRTGRPRRMSYR